jgi:hypothetical protein
MKSLAEQAKTCPICGHYSTKSTTILECKQKDHEFFCYSKIREVYIRLNNFAFSSQSFRPIVDGEAFIVQCFLIEAAGNQILVKQITASSIWEMANEIIKSAEEYILFI